MFGVTTSDDYRPVTWMERYPVDVTTILVGLHVGCAILTAFLFAIGSAGALNYAMFDSAQVWLHALLLLVPALILTLWGLSTRTGLAGSGPLHFAVFVAFVTLYPNVQFFLRIPAKWIFVILAAIWTLSALAAHDWQDLVAIWASIAVAFFFIELHGAGPELAWVSNLKSRLRPKPRLHIVQKTSTRRVVEPD